MNGSDSEIHDRLDAIFPRALLAGLVGLAACVAAGAYAPSEFLQAYLVGFLFWLGISLGGVALTMLHHLVGGGWGIMIRRPMEAAGMLLPPMALFFLPIAFGMKQLYPWTNPGEYTQHVVARYYLNPTGFLVRTAIYFAIWILFAFLLDRWSAEQDRTEGEAPTDRLKTLSGPGLAVCFLTGTFAAIDWMMSLEPDWYSTIYGAMVIVGFGLATFTTMILIAALLARHEPVSSVATPTMFQDLGNLTLAFVMLWAYMAFSQFLIVWCGNLTEEIPWYLRRTHGGWEFVAIALIVFHFFAPFFFLLFRENKRSKGSLMLLAAGVILMHLVDLVWLVIPARANVLEPIRIPWFSVLLVIPATLGIGGFWVALLVRRLKIRPLLPIRDPAYLAELAHRAEAHHV
jgi:hypothetical protein